MRYNFDDNIARLKSRRYDNALTGQQYITEDFEKRAQGKATQYAIGAMQEVSRRSTQISYEEFDKVKKAIQDRLPARGFSPDIRLQGSLPLNVHIRGVSDVDLLEVNGQFYTYAPNGPKGGTYTPMISGNTAASKVLRMRTATEEELGKHFYAATVDRSNAKSIQLSGGAFRRKVDVVPSHWHDTENYQRHQDEIYRGVCVINKQTHETINNFPFLFGHHINDKGHQTSDGSKMATRLLKNIKSDNDENNHLSSYDIASLMYHCPNKFIKRYPARDLAVLSGTEKWISGLTVLKYSAMDLDTPDGTRKIIDSEKKWEELCSLAAILTELSEAVFKEVVGPYYNGGSTLQDIRKALDDRTIPMVPSY